MDYTDAWLRDLTRQRRVELRARKLAARPPCIRVSASMSVEFDPNAVRACDDMMSPYRSRQAKKRASLWRREQWRIGNRLCYLCRIPTKLKLSDGIDRIDTITVDHKTPLSRNGADDPSNWAICCFGCNNKKGPLTEAEYRRVFICIEVEKAA